MPVSIGTTTLYSTLAGPRLPDACIAYHSPPHVASSAIRAYGTSRSSSIVRYFSLGGCATHS